jgi:uncharacterized protein
MPVAVSYPGVYVQEIPSGVHTISGVSTSLTAFVGRTYMGPVNTAISISSFADFQRFFGGLSEDYPLSYAVRDFFQNGGSQGVVVRLFASGWSSGYSQTAAVGDAHTAAAAVVGGLSTFSGTVGGDNNTIDAITKAVTAKNTFPLPDPEPLEPTQASVQNAAATGMVKFITSLLDDGAELANISDLATAAAAGGSAPGSVVAAAAPPIQASVTLAGGTGFDAISAANAVLSAAGKAALAANATPQSVIQAATRMQNKFLTAGQYTQGIVSATIAHAAGATPAGVVNAISGGIPSVFTGVNALPNVTSDTTTSLTNAAAVVAAAWTAAMATSPAATRDTVSEAATNAVTPGDAASEAVAVAASIAAAIPGAQPADVAAAAAQAVQTAVAQASTPTLVLSVAPGDWPNQALSASVDTNGITLASARALNSSFQAADLFNLSVTYNAPGGATSSERFVNVSLRKEAGPLRLDRVLVGSNFVSWTFPGAASTPPANGAVGVATGGSAGAYLSDNDYLGSQATKTGIYALDNFDLFNLLVMPMDRRLEDDPAFPGNDVFEAAAVYCQQRRAFLLVEPPAQWSTEWSTGALTNASMTDVGSYGPEGRNAAVFFPRIIEQDPLRNSQPALFSASGAIAGIMARTDANRGVWKAPAGVNDGAISGAQGLELKLTDFENGILNPLGINCLRSFPVFGSVVWGARTLKGADQLSDDYKYIPVRRLALYIEESLYRGTQWAVFEPNAEPLWAGLRLAAGSFMNQLFRQGAFAGSSAKDAYFVACDATTTTQADIDAGVVNVTVGFAPLLPAEFVVLSIQQIAGQLAT